MWNFYKPLMNCFQSPANCTVTVVAGPFGEWERFCFCIKAEALLQMSPYFKKQVFRMAHAVCFTRLQYALGFTQKSQISSCSYL